MSIVKKILLVLVIITSNSISSQFRIEISDDLLTYYDNKSNEVKILKKDSILSINLDSNLLNRSYLNIDESLNFDNGKELIHVELNGENYFLQSGNGRVYTIKDNRLERLDKSLIDNAFFDSSIFTYNDKIFRFGGYGFWTIYNKLIYFDLITNQWELYESENIPLYGTISAFAHLYQNNLYVIGGMKYSEDSQNRQIFSNSIMRFNFDKNLWDSNFKFDNDISLKKINADEDEVLVIALKSSSTDRVIKSLNFKENKEYTYRSTPFLPSIDMSKDFFKSKDYLVFYTKVNDRSELNIIPSNYLLTEKEYSGKIFKHDYTYLYLILGSIILVIIYLRLFYHRSIKTLILNQNGIMIKNKFAELDPLSVKLLNIVQSKGNLTTSQLNDIIFNDSLSRASNYSRKNKLLDNINSKFKLISGSNDLLINKEKSKFDLRMEVYKLNQRVRINNNIN